MYVHRNQLQHLLKPEHYFSEAQYRGEMERLFLPAWHLVATRAELARPGDKHAERQVIRLTPSDIEDLGAFLGTLTGPVVQPR